MFMFQACYVSQPGKRKMLNRGENRTRDLKPTHSAF